jgi:hypothetical protein
MTTRFYWLFLGILNVWRITHLLQAEDGPWEVVVRLRRAAGEGFWGELLDCFYCLSMWVAIPLAFILGKKPVERIFLWPALSAGAIMLERLTNLAYEPPPAPYYGDGENNNVMLRQTEETVKRD